MGTEQGLIDGIGGIFLKANDPAALVAWYERTLGIQFTPYEPGKSYGMEFITIDSPKDREKKSTIFAMFKAKTPLPEGVRDQHEINFRVMHLEPVIARLNVEGVEIVKREDSEYGKFVCVHDLEGNRIELFEPI